jgi:hypothetical protein
MKRLTPLLVLVCIIGSSWGHIEPVVEDQEAMTLPRLLLHFSKSVAVVEVQRVDTERGLVRFAVVERIQGAQELREVRQLFLREGRMPDGLRDLKTGQKAVFFGEDSEGQSFLYAAGLWCHSLLRDDSGWRRLHDIRPLYNGGFAGSVSDDLPIVRSMSTATNGSTPSPPPASAAPVNSAPSLIAKAGKSRVSWLKL